MNLPDWTKEWQAGFIIPDEVKQFIIESEIEIQKIMVRLPPGCIVKPKRTLLGPKEFGIVSDYYLPNYTHQNGKVSVKDYPGSHIKYVVDVDDLEVVGYFKGLDKKRVERIIAENTRDLLKGAF